jgi:hypothetical protein
MSSDHEPHQPFIRITDWHKDNHSQWMSAESFCSICRKQVRLVFAGAGESKARWEHIDSHWEHAGEHSGGGEPQLPD